MWALLDGDRHLGCHGKLGRKAPNQVRLAGSIYPIKKITGFFLKQLAWGGKGGGV